MSLRLTSSFLAFLLCTAAIAQSVVVEARLDSASIRVGQHTLLHTSVSCNKGDRVQWPAFERGLLIDSVEILESSPIDTLLLNDGRRWTLSRSYRITAFDSAVYVLPPFEVKIGNNNYTSQEPLALKVNSIAVDEAHPDQLKSPHAPVEATFQWQWTTLCLTLVVWGLTFLLIPLIAALVRRQPLMRKLRVSPPPPPHLQALKAIEQLRGATCHSHEDQKAYYMQLSDVLRSYLHDRFGFSAREMTTQEIVQTLQNSDNQQALRELHELLSTADLVKFARYAPSLVENDRALLQAADYVQRTQLITIEIPQAQPQFIPLTQKLQTRWRRLLQMLLGIDLLAIFLLLVYVCHQLWSDFA